jgi:hypothetical protein
VAIGFALALDAFRWGFSAAFTLLLGWTSVGWLMALAFNGPFVVSFDRDCKLPWIELTLEGERGRQESMRQLNVC